MEKRLRHLLARLVVLVAVLSQATVAVASTVNARPGDDLQALVNDLCDAGGGTLRLAAGTYPVTKTLLLWCEGVTLRGAGRDKTTLLWTGTDVGNGPGCPAGPPPLVGRNIVTVAPYSDTSGLSEFPFPCTPPDPFRLLDNVTIEHLAIVRDTPPAAQPSVAIGSLWSNNLNVRHIRTAGFQFGVWSARSDNLAVEHSQIQASPGGSCVAFVDGPLFASTLSPFKPRLFGGRVRHNKLQSCVVGVSAFNVEGLVVEHNTARNVVVGVLIRAGSNAFIRHNTIADAQDAFVLFQSYDSVISHNTICGRGVGDGLNYGPRDDYWFANGFMEPSGGNGYNHNQHFGVDEIVDVDDPNYLGTNTATHNQSKPASQCPLQP
jgi:hypothetical protein